MKKVFALLLMSLMASAQDEIYLAGYNVFQEGKYPEALTYFKAYHKAVGNTETALWSLAKTYARLDSIKQSNNYLEQLFKGQYDHTRTAYYNELYGSNLITLKDYKKAISIYSDLLENYDSVQALGLYYYNRGYAKYQLKTPDACQDIYEASNRDFRIATVMLDKECKNWYKNYQMSNAPKLKGTQTILSGNTRIEVEKGKAVSVKQN